MQEENRFENILKSLRVRKGKAWTQERTAELLNVSLRTYKGWESGERIPAPEYLKAIVSLFELSQEDEDTLYRVASQVAPRLHNLPFPPNPFFTGRETYLRRIGQAFTASSNVSISGLGGIGKTQLALEYAHHCYKAKTCRGVFWIDAAEKATLEASYLALAQLLELLGKDVVDTRRVIRAVNRWLENHTDWLLVMDNVDDLALARTFLPVAHHGHILLTTRSQIAGMLAWQIDVAEMEPDEGLRFLLKRAQVEVDDAASQVVTLLGALPLALEQAGAYVEETGVSFDEYAKLFQEHRNYMLSRQGADTAEHPESVAVTIEMSIQKASERHPLATDILSFCAFLQPDAIPEELFQFDDTFKADMLAFNESITALRRYSLIRRSASEKTFSIHRLVQAVVIDALPAEQTTPWKNDVLLAVKAAFPADALNPKNWQLCDRLMPHTECVTWEEVDPVAIIELCYQTACYLDARRRESFEFIEARLCIALELSERYFGADHIVTARLLSHVADFYAGNGKEDEGSRMFQRAVAIHVKHPEDDPVGAAKLLLSLADLASKRGKDSDYEALTLRALGGLEKHLGADHQDVALVLGGLAGHYVSQDKVEQAIPLYRRACKIFDKQVAAGNMDARDPRIALSLSGISMMLQMGGKHEEAEKLTLLAKDALEQLWGPEHPDIALMYALEQLHESEYPVPEWMEKPWLLDAETKETERDEWDEWG